ncbi:MAG: LysM peptidoglycan-binding domain-containing protein, partial [Propionibacteriaceae bacterium]|nr:LysM peptidoglycan-binding domain-containing protein [Propionibacteriaceae bacterium]
MRGGLAMGALIALVAGVPLVLFHATRAFAPSRWPGWSGVWAGLTRPDDGTIVAVLLLVAGWVAWFYLMAAVVAEVASRRRGRRLPTLTLLQPGQLVARVLVGAVVALFLSFAPPTPASASEPTSPVETESAAAPSPAAAPSSATEAVPADDEGATHVVQAGDTLFGLAERYLGDGDRWPELAAANPNLVWDPDHIEPGWTLAVPKGQSSAGAVRETRVAGAAAPAGPTGSSSLPVAVSAALPADSAGPAAGDEPAGPAAVSAGAAAAPA